MRINVPIPTATMEAKIDVIDGYHDVPTADAVTNAQMRDVIGNKTDAVIYGVSAVKSVISYVKGAVVLHIAPVADSTSDTYARDTIGNKEDAAHSDYVSTTKSLMSKAKGILGVHVVPAADVTDNAHLRDVIGNKGDASYTTISGLRTLMAYVKGILGWMDVPAADTVDNYAMADVVGNKTDAAQTTVGTTRSIIMYVKGILNALATHVTALGTHATALGVVDGNVDAILVDTGTTLPTALGVVDGNVDNLEAERLQRVVAHFVQAVTTSSTLTDIVNISDKGVLTGISQMPVGSDSMRLKIIIDGGTVLDDFTFTKLAETPRSIACNHRFDTSLQIQHASTDNSTQVQTLVSYTTD